MGRGPRELIHTYHTKQASFLLYFSQNSILRKKGPGGPFFDKTDSLVVQRLLCSIAEIVTMQFFCTVRSARYFLEKILEIFSRNSEKS